MADRLVSLQSIDVANDHDDGRGEIYIKWSASAGTNFNNGRLPRGDDEYKIRSGGTQIIDAEDRHLGTFRDLGPGDVLSLEFDVWEEDDHGDDDSLGTAKMDFPYPDFGVGIVHEIPSSTGDCVLKVMISPA